MLPDGPSRDESPVSTDFLASSEVSNGVEFCIPSKIFRDAAENNADHMHIWEDGTREKMTICLANLKDVRGWYCVHGNTAVFQWPIVPSSPENLVLEGKSLVDKTDASTRHAVYNICMSMGDKEKYLKLADQSVAHFGKIKASFGDLIAYREHREMERKPGGDGPEWREIVYKAPVHFLFLCMENETVVLRTTYPDGPQLEELPVTKFLIEYSLSRHLSPNKVSVPLSTALSLAIVCKAVIKFRRLHLVAQERKFAPGGVGFKRALESETAQFINKRAFY